MHRLLTKAPPGLCVDHIDHNGLNNTRRNLRLCTKAQNSRKARPQRNTASEYKGVSPDTNKKAWQARIWQYRKPIYIGYFKNEEQTARAYDKKAKELFGEFAYINFPDE